MSYLTGEGFTLRQAIAAGTLTALGFTAASCAIPEGPEYKTIKVCDRVDGRLEGIGHEIDTARFFFGDGNITSRAKTIYKLHTEKFGVVEVDDDTYLEHPKGSLYCESKDVPIETPETPSNS